MLADRRTSTRQLIKQLVLEDSGALRLAFLQQLYQLYTTSGSPARFSTGLEPAARQEHLQRKQDGKGRGHRRDNTEHAGSSCSHGPERAKREAIDVESSGQHPYHMVAAVLQRSPEVFRRPHQSGGTKELPRIKGVPILPGGMLGLQRVLLRYGNPKLIARQISSPEGAWLRDVVAASAAARLWQLRMRLQAGFTGLFMGAFEPVNQVYVLLRRLRDALGSLLGIGGGAAAARGAFMGGERCAGTGIAHEQGLRDGGLRLGVEPTWPNRVGGSGTKGWHKPDNSMLRRKLQRMLRCKWFRWFLRSGWYGLVAAVGLIASMVRMQKANELTES